MFSSFLVSLNYIFLVFCCNVCGQALVCPSENDVDVRLKSLVDGAYHPVAMSTLELAGTAGRALLESLQESYLMAAEMDDTSDKQRGEQYYSLICILLYI